MLQLEREVPKRPFFQLGKLKLISVDARSYLLGWLQGGRSERQGLEDGRQGSWATFFSVKLVNAKELPADTARGYG